MTSRKKKAEFSDERVELNPLELLKQAKKEAPKPELVLAGDYVQVIDSLRKKGFCWAEIAEWFKAKGVPYSLGSLRRAYRIAYEG